MLRRLLDPAARAQSVAGLAMLEHGMRQIGHPSFGLTALVYESGRRPRWPGGPDFNISHSDGLAACVLSETARVGLDVERIRPVQARALRRVCTAQELQAAGEDSRALLSLWTRREAVLKAAGGMLRDIARVSLDGSVARFHGACWWLYPLDLGSGYVAWAAADRHDLAFDAVAVPFP